MNPEEKIIFGSRCGGIGDNLAFSPLMKYFKNCTLELLDHPKSRNVASLFEGLCSINFSENPAGIKESSHPHVAQKKIEGYGIQDIVTCIPEIKLYEDEIAQARKDLQSIKNPVAFVSDNNGSGDPKDYTAKYRIPNKEILQSVVDALSEEYTVLQFSLSSNLSKYENVTPILDLPLRKLAAYYHVIGKYAGVDTGDYHLMLSVGGVCEVICPQSSGHYQHSSWHYTPELWRSDPCRAKYHIFS